MNYLVDTHALIWFIIADKNLPENVKSTLESLENTCFISIAVLWEIAIKHSIGKLVLKQKLENIFDIIKISGFQLLHIKPEHLLLNAQLKFHHNDPFDRLMIAQSIIENLILVSKDSKFIEYDVDLNRA